MYYLNLIIKLSCVVCFFDVHSGMKLFLLLVLCLIFFFVCRMCVLCVSDVFGLFLIKDLVENPMCEIALIAHFIKRAE